MVAVMMALLPARPWEREGGGGRGERRGSDKGRENGV